MFKICKINIFCETKNKNDGNIEQNGVKIANSVSY